MTSYSMRPLQGHESVALNGYTHKGVILATDLTVAVDGTVQALDLGPIPDGSKIQIMVDALVPFENTLEPANDTTTVSFGDTGSATSLLAAQQVNRNGTEITDMVEGNLSTVYAAVDTLKATFTPKAATQLAELNKGQLVYFVRILCPVPYLNAGVPSQAGILR